MGLKSLLALTNSVCTAPAYVSCLSNEEVLRQAKYDVPI